MDQEALLKLARKHLIRYPSAFAPFVVSRAEESWIWDQDGNRYLDFTSGPDLLQIGHNHPRIVEAIREACDRVLHLNLVDAVRGGHPAGRAPGRPGPVKRDAAGRPACETCDLACLEQGFEAFDRNSVGSLAAVVVEPVPSAGGVIDPPLGYLKRMQELTHERGGLLIVDEAQTGFGRLGTMFGFEQDGIVPDVLTVSKTLGGGLPVAATIVSEEVEATAVERGFFHVTSHVSDPLPAGVGLAVLDVIVEEGLVERAAKLGQLLREGFEELAKKYEVIGDIRGRGLLLGVEIVKDRGTREPAPELGAAITDECLKRGLSMNLVRGMGASVWRIAPPLTVLESEVGAALDTLEMGLALQSQASES